LTIVALTHSNAHLLEQQSSYTPAQRRFAIKVRKALKAMDA
jgi:hypothetical protein